MHDHPPVHHTSNHKLDAAVRAATHALNCTKMEAFLFAFFEALPRISRGQLRVENLTHRRTVGGVEADIYFELGKQSVCIFSDGHRYHGGDEHINGGAKKIRSDRKRRRLLAKKGVRILSLREDKLPPLRVGTDISVKYLDRDFKPAAKAIALALWPAHRDAVEGIFQCRETLRDIRTRALSSIIQQLKKRYISRTCVQAKLTRRQYADLLRRCLFPDAKKLFSIVGTGWKWDLLWRCPDCAEKFDAPILGLLTKAKSRGCPFCGHKKLRPEDSIEAHPEMSVEFICLVDEPKTPASEISQKSNKLARWRCRRAGCNNVCKDIPNNRRKTTSGYCKDCARDNRRDSEKWPVRRDIRDAVDRSIRQLRRPRILPKPRHVFAALPATTRRAIHRAIPVALKRTRWMSKRIRKVC